jgi:hypothetical protein
MFRILTFHDNPLQFQCFNIVLTVLTNQDEATWLDSQHSRVLLLRRSLSAQYSCVFQYLRLRAFMFYGTRLSFNHFMLKYVLYIIKNKPACFLCFCSYFIFLLLVCQVLGTTQAFHTEGGLWCL